MNRKITILSLLAVFILIATSFGAVGNTSTENYLIDVSSTFSAEMPTAIAVSDSNPFYALIATPLAVHYDDEGEQTVIPLYVKNFDEPSKAVERAEQQIGIYADLIISDVFTPKEISLLIAEMFWEESSAALLIKEDQTGYELGMVATPLASYLGIPIIVTDEVDLDVWNVLDNLGVTYVYVCGDLFNRGSPGGERGGLIIINKFYNVESIIDECIEVIGNRFDETVGYITMANPLDVYPPTVVAWESHVFTQEIASGIALPTQTIGSIFNDAFAIHEFEIPADYKYARVKIDLTNLDSEHAQSLGDRITILLNSPEPDSHRYLFASTAGGIPERDINGNIVEDKIQYEITISQIP